MGFFFKTEGEGYETLWTNLPLLGGALKSYSNSLAGLDPDGIANAEIELVSLKHSKILLTVNLVTLWVSS